MNDERLTKEDRRFLPIVVGRSFLLLRNDRIKIQNRADGFVRSLTGLCQKDDIAQSSRPLKTGAELIHPGDRSTLGAHEVAESQPGLFE